MCTRPYLGLSQAINFFFDQRTVFHFLIIRGETDTQSTVLFWHNFHKEISIHYHKTFTALSRFPPLTFSHRLLFLGLNLPCSVCLPTPVTGTQRGRPPWTGCHQIASYNNFFLFEYVQAASNLTPNFTKNETEY